MFSMPKIEKQIQVEYRHQIHFTEGVFCLENHLLSQLVVDDTNGRRLVKVLVVVDAGLISSSGQILSQIVGYFHAIRDGVELVCDPVVIQGGEVCKNDWGLVTQLMGLADRYHIDRHSYIIAIGGGALLDMVGLAASITHRGVRHIRIPTTTLSQDDSGVGVKNGINFFGKKNFLGTFSPPYAVVNDFRFIEKLPEREKKNGYIEAVKVALIRDAGFFEEIEGMCDELSHFASGAMKRLIYRCAELHVNHISTSGDPFEFGSARPLDFGHWAAHKLEQLSNYEIRHGEAVAIGIGLDIIYARRMGYLSGDDCNRILKLIGGLGFELWTDYLLAEESGVLAILRGLEEFREHLGGLLTITLLRGIGKGFEVHEMDSSVIVDSIRELRQG